MNDLKVKCPQCGEYVDELVSAADLGYDKHVCQACYGYLMEAKDYEIWLKKELIKEKEENFIKFLMSKKHILCEMLENFERKNNNAR